MSKKFNDAVQYVRNGVSIPAIVLNSRTVTEQVPVPKQNDPTLTKEKITERLTLLYADPITGLSLVQAGKSSAAGKTEFDVKPLEPGMVFGWLEFGEYGEPHDAPIQAHLAATAAVAAQSVPEDPTKVVTEAHKTGLPVADPLLKTSGDGADAGDWTKAGMTVEGFPVAKGSAEDVTTKPELLDIGGRSGVMTPESIAEHKAQLAKVVPVTPEGTPSAADLDARAAEDAAKAATARPVIAAQPAVQAQPTTPAQPVTPAQPEATAQTPKV